MKTWFWTLLVFIAAVALALVLRDHNGNVLIMVQPWRIELSLTFAVLILIAVFVILHVALRLLSWVAHGPGRFRSWRRLRSQKRDHNLLESGWVNILEGRYEQADKDLTRLLGKTRSHTSKVVAGLASARAAHHLADRDRRDDALKTARVSARDDARLKEAVAIVTAEMYLDDDRPEDALALVQPLQDASSRYFHATRLLLRAHQQLGNHDRVYELTRLLIRRGAINPAQARTYIESSGAARLAAAGADGFRTVWNDFKSDEKTSPGLALMAATVQTKAGNHDDAARILENAINVSMDPRLLAAYAQCPAQHVKRRLNKAEVWLRASPDNASLLAALGTLCLTGEIWGQAERYLLESMRLRSDVRIHALLGNLYDGLGRHDDARRHWRLAADVAGKLPVLTIDRALPAADTRHDPLLADVEVDITSIKTDDTTMQMPAAASAADVVSDDLRTHTGTSAKKVASHTTTGTTASYVDDAMHDYFDTAPIPGVDVTQTSDQPRGVNNKH